ncbi:hypothetical protein [Algiphilus sp.]|uniref:hypothetical protein n=1 Tax=Algiphilus sp. TaxID=1872431 RepID=UPI0032ECA874
MRWSAITLVRYTAGAALLLAANTGYTDAISFQGYSGLLESPDASVTPEGEIRIHYNNDVESTAALPTTRTIDTAENYLFSIGLWDRVEIGGRLAMAYRDTGPRRARTDLSGNLKIRLLEWRNIAIAAGIADFAGEAQNLEARYGVGTLTLPQFLDARLTLGFGAGPDRLDGVIAGAEVPITNFASLIADYDAEEANYGLRLQHRFSNGITLRGTAGGTTASGFDPSFGLTLALPLDLSRSAPAPHSMEVRASADSEAPANRPVQVTVGRDAATVPSASTAPRPPETDSAKVIVSTDTPRNSLIKWQRAGLMNEAGAMTGTAGTAVEYRYGIPLRELASDGTLQWSSSWKRLPHWLEMPLRAEFRFEPFLRSIVGTETGAFEYALAADSTARAQLPAGIGAYLTYTSALGESDDFREGGRFANRQQESALRESAIQWAFHPAPGLITLATYGQTRIEELDYDFMHLEAALLLGGGTHRLRYAYGDYQPFDELNFQDRSTKIAEYRYFWRDPQVLFEVQHGEYFFDQEGTKLEVSRFFGDIAVHLFYHRDDDDREQAGFGFTLPLTPGREPRLGPVVITGAHDWRYAVSTTINDESGDNVLLPTFLLEPVPQYNLTDDILDRDRAFPAYVR